jgi:hypothetical protein
VLGPSKPRPALSLARLSTVGEALGCIVLPPLPSLVVRCQVAHRLTVPPPPPFFFAPA